MPKRFNNLDAALKYLRPTNASSDTEIPDAPNNSQLAQYQKYKAGKLKIEYPRANGSKPGAIDELIVKPFALGGSDDDKALVGISRRAKDGIAQTGLAFADLNTTEPSTTNKAEKIYGFQPAQAIITVSQTGTIPENSKITGRPYKKRSANSYTLPFGKANATETYAEKKSAILAKVSAGDNNRGVSFNAEIYR